MHRSYALIVSSHCVEITKIGSQRTDRSSQCVEITKISSQRIDRPSHCVESKKIAPQRTDNPKKTSINRKKHHKQKTSQTKNTDDPAGVFQREL